MLSDRERRKSSNTRPSDLGDNLLPNQKAKVQLPNSWHFVQRYQSPLEGVVQCYESRIHDAKAADCPVTFLQICVPQLSGKDRKSGDSARRSSVETADEEYLRTSRARAYLVAAWQHFHCPLIYKIPSFCVSILLRVKIG